MDERALAEIRRLEARDAELAVESRRLRSLAEDVETARERAETIEGFFAAYPAEEKRRRAAYDEAREDLGRRRAEASRAGEEVEQARTEEQREAAQRSLARAADRVAVAEARLARAAEATAELEREAAALPQEIPALEERARRVSAELPQLPAAPTGLPALREWASRARALLFVATGQLDAQRERVIREANELGTMLLGEPTYGATTTQVRQRIEAAR